MYDELIKRLWECVSGECWNCSQHKDSYDGQRTCADNLMKQAADAIEELEGKHFMMKKTAEWLAEKVPTWVSVTERLPSAHELVLVYNPGYLMTTGFLYEDGRWRVRSVDYPNTPTHWMPLPEPPKEG